MRALGFKHALFWGGNAGINTNSHKPGEKMEYSLASLLGKLSDLFHKF